MFLLDVVDFFPDNTLWEFGKVLSLVTARGLLDFLDSPPTVVEVRQAQSCHDSEWDVSSLSLIRYPLHTHPMPPPLTLQSRDV